MRRRYLAGYRPVGLQPPDRRRLHRAGQVFDLDVRFDDDKLILHSDSTLPFHEHDSNLLLGPVARPAVTDQRTIDRLIGAGRAEELIRNAWGDFVAVSRTADILAVIRSPFGDLGCYHFCDDGLWVMASDADILSHAVTRPLTLDRTALAWALGRGEMIGARTCLNGVGDLRGGSRLTIDRHGKARIDDLWSPWVVAAAPHRDECDAADDLRSSVATAVKEKVRGHASALVMISGGLDSSIVTASLSDTTVRFACMTLVSEDAAGDERDYARLAASAAGADLFEVDRRAAAVDVRHSSTARLAWPTGRSFAQEADASTALLARQLGATAVIDGGGGDNVFCSHLSVAAVADCLLDPRAFSHLFATARALGDLAEAGLPAIMGRSLRRAWLRERRIRAPLATSFLTPEAVATTLAQPDHPWLVTPHGALPGKAVHVGLIAVAQAIVEAGYETTAVDRVSPLISQPVIEACLRVPSWMWFAPGRDRAAARRAFEDRLPSEILDRRSKGSPNLFAASLVVRYRETLEHLLYDGVLANEGLLDVDRLRPVLSDPARIWSQQFVRILRLADVEAWARHWV